jgi:hypothetical protein
MPRVKERTISCDLELTVDTCCACHVIYALPTELRERRLNDGEWFYCPNGHAQRFTESEIDRLKREVLKQQAAREQAEANAKWWNTYASEQAQEAVQANRRAAAQKGAMTRLKKRVHNGVCPECNRSFANLRRHMECKHPTFGKDEPALGSGTQEAEIVEG